MSASIRWDRIAALALPGLLAALTACSGAEDDDASVDGDTSGSSSVNTVLLEPARDEKTNAGTLSAATWSMDEAFWASASGSVIDSSGYGRHGSALGGATTSGAGPALAGSPGSCTFGRFNGVNQSVSVPYDATLNPAGSFTLSFWARVSGGASTWRSAITSRWHDASGAQRQGYTVYGSADDNRWQFWLGNASTWAVLRGPAIEVGKWTHVAARFQATSVTSTGVYSGVQTLFINGREAARSGTVRYKPNNRSPLNIGSGGNAGDQYRFVGDLDEVEVYRGALTANEILGLSTATHVCADTPPQAKLLVVHAHPDDEGIFGGGVLSYYARNLGVSVTDLLMATRNPNGSYPLASGGSSRVQEMRNAIDLYAGRSLGSGAVNARGHYVSGNITLVEGGLLDTGCCSADPAGSWNSASDGYSWGLAPNVTLLTPGLGNMLGIPDGRRAAATVIAREIRRFRPSVVVSVHDLEGDYGHENHSATAIGAIEGYDLAADSSVVIDGLPAWRAAKLYLRGSAAENYYRAGNPANGVITWGSFTPVPALGSLFHDDTEAAGLFAASPRVTADQALLQHASQGANRASSVFVVGEGYEGHHSEWWTLVRSTVPADLLSSFSIAGDATGTFYTNWARGNFLTNVAP